MWCLLFEVAEIGWGVTLEWLCVIYNASGLLNAPERVDVLSVDGEVRAARQQEDRGHEEPSTRCNFPPSPAATSGSSRLGVPTGPVPGSFPVNIWSPAGESGRKKFADTIHIGSTLATPRMPFVRQTSTSLAVRSANRLNGPRGLRSAGLTEAGSDPPIDLGSR